MLELGQWAWAMLDPMLLKMRARLEHLAEHHPTVRRYDQAVVDPSANILPEARLENVDAPESLRIGAWTTVRSQVAVVARGGRIELGHHCYVGEGSRIWAQQRVKVGNFVLIAHYVDIHDTNGHSLDYRDRRQDTIALFEERRSVDWGAVSAQPVVIDDDVWIGLKSTILKGVTIGRGAVVAACSLVRDDVPPFTLVAGNPARVVGAPGMLEQGGL